MSRSFNTPPGWPPVPDGWTPPASWQPDPSWPAAPDNWVFWVSGPGELNTTISSATNAAVPNVAANRRWLGPTLAGVGGLVLGLVIGSAGGGGDAGSATAAQPQPTVTVTAPAAEPATETPAEAPAPASAEVAPPAADSMGIGMAKEGFVIQALTGEYSDFWKKTTVTARMTNNSGVAFEDVYFYLTIQRPDGTLDEVQASSGASAVGATVTAQFFEFAGEQFEVVDFRVAGS